jgi:hypothetical protein
MEKPEQPSLTEFVPPSGENDNLPVVKQSWLEAKLKPKVIHHRYPFRGKPLLWMTCAFGSLGDALFGYDQGMFFPPLGPKDPFFGCSAYGF